MKIKLINVERVVGNIPETVKEQILREREERFNDQDFETLKDKEREKTPEEIEIIGLVNGITNEIRKKYGLEEFNIPPDNIHVIEQDKWIKDRRVKESYNAVFDSIFQAVVMREQPARIIFAKKVLHEMIHFKSYGAWQVTKGEKPELDMYRIGLAVYTRDGEKGYFKNLNEALTEEITKRFSAELFSNQIFAREQKQTEEIMSEYPDTATESGEPLFDEDTFYAEAIDRQNDRIKIETDKFGFAEERKLLNVLIDKLFERNQENFQNREEVFEMFARRMMTGNTPPLGELIDKTFGRKTFKKIGELDQDTKAQEEFINSL